MINDENKSSIDKLMELKSLYESGVITKEEMEVMKQRILSQDNPLMEISETQTSVDDSPQDCNIGECKEERKAKEVEVKSDESTEEKKSEPKEDINIISNSKQPEDNNEAEGFEQPFSFKKFGIIIGAIALLIALIVLISPPNYRKRLDKAIEKYEAEGAEVLQTSGSKTNKDNHYIIFIKNDIPYVDELSREATVKEAIPSGVYVKYHEAVLNVGRPYLNCTSSSFAFYDFERQPDLDGHRSFCFTCKYGKDKENKYTYYYSLNNPDTLFAFSDSVCYSDENVNVQFGFSFADLVDSSSKYYYDYKFYILGCFSMDDMSFKGFSQFMTIDRKGYPNELINKYVDHSLYKANTDGTISIDLNNITKLGDFVGYLVQDVNRKEKLAIIGNGKYVAEFNDDGRNCMFFLNKNENQNFNNLSVYEYKTDNVRTLAHEDSDGYSSYFQTAQGKIHFETIEDAFLSENKENIIAITHMGSSMFSSYYSLVKINTHNYSVSKICETYYCERQGNVIVATELKPVGSIYDYECEADIVWDETKYYYDLNGNKIR